MAKKVVGKPKAGTTLKRVTKTVSKGTKIGGVNVGSLFKAGTTVTGKVPTTGRRSRKHGTMWYLREIQRARAKRKYYKEKLKL